MMMGTQEEFQNVSFVRYFFEEPYSSEVITFVTSNPNYIQAYVENDLSFVA